jgi:hypothetical protein
MDVNNYASHFLDRQSGPADGPLRCLLPLSIAITIISVKKFSVSIQV